MDLDGDGWLDLVTINDGDIASDERDSRREHVFRNDGKGRFRRRDRRRGGRRRTTSAKTTTWWRSSTSTATATPTSSSARSAVRIACSSTTGTAISPARLDVFSGEATPGTLGLALADLDGDGRMDVVQGQGEHKTAVAGARSTPDAACHPTPPRRRSAWCGRPMRAGGATRRARPRPRSQEPQPGHRVAPGRGRMDRRRPARVTSPMRWYGEYLWAADWPADCRPGDALSGVRHRRRRQHGVRISDPVTTKGRPPWNRRSRRC